MNTDPIEHADGEDFSDSLPLWAIPLDEPEPPPLPVPVPPNEDTAPFLMEFPGADAPPPLGFTPRLRRDNEAA